MIVPTFDRAEVLARAVRSVVRQADPAWELLVVDDAGNDGSRELVDSFGDPRIRYHRREINGGVAAAQNTGLALARTDQVAFLHSDDEWCPEFVRCMRDSLRSAPASVGGVECGREMIEAGGAVDIQPPRMAGASPAALLDYSVGVHISPLILRTDVARSVGFDEALRHTEDRDFCIRLLRQTRLAAVQSPLVRLHREAPGLRNENKADTYEYLLEKYRDDITGTSRLHAEWQLRIARSAFGSGDLPRARLALRRCIRINPRRARRWLLGAALVLPDPAFSSVVRAYVSGSRAAARRGLR